MGHVKTSRRAAGGRFHEDVDRIDLHARDPGVVHHEERRGRERVEDFVLAVGGDVGPKRMGAGGDELVLEDADVLEGSLELCDDVRAEGRSGLDRGWRVGGRGWSRAGRLRRRQLAKANLAAERQLLYGRSGRRLVATEQIADAQAL